MRDRLIIGVTVMIVTIVAMAWIYIDRNQKNSILVIRNSNSPFGEETICTDSKEPK